MLLTFWLSYQLQDKGGRATHLGNVGSNMNEILRLLQRSLRPFGYDIRKRNTFNLLPCKGVGPTPCLDRVRNNFDYDGGPERKSDSNLDRLKIVVRTCLTEQRNLKKSNGPADGASLVDTVERCLLSLIGSVNAALLQEIAPRVEVIILDDHSDAPYLERIRHLAGRLKCPWHLQTTKSHGQGESLHEHFTMARTEDALFYFCEEDYLHESRAIYEMWAFYRQVFQSTHRHLILHPQEQESLYKNSHDPAYLVLSPFRHWRSVSNTTHTFFTHSHVVRDFWKYFENTKFMGTKKRRIASESKTTNLLYRHLPCFVPIPALAGHFQSLECLPAFFDWRTLWNANDPRAQI